MFKVHPETGRTYANIGILVLLEERLQWRKWAMAVIHKIKYTVS